jgi:hypothetical protein
MTEQTATSRKSTRSRATTRPSAAEATKTARATTSSARRRGRKDEHVDTGPSLPVLVPEVHVRHVPLPRVGIAHVPVPRVSVPSATGLRRRLPERDTGRLLWFGGLAGLAAFGVIEWPVAGVVAAGTWIAERRAEAAHADGRSGPAAPAA